MSYSQKIYMKKEIGSNKYYPYITNFKRNNKEFGDTFTLTNNKFLENTSHLILSLGSKFNELKVISNIKEEDLIKFDPFTFNPKSLGYYKIFTNNLNEYFFYSSYNDVFVDFRTNISNNYNISDFIFNNNEKLPIINMAINYLSKK